MYSIVPLLCFHGHVIDVMDHDDLQVEHRWWTMEVDHSHFSARNSQSKHAAVAYCNQYGLRSLQYTPLQVPPTSPNEIADSYFENWGWDWWFSSCVSPCTSKVYWSPWRRQTRCSVQRWWVLGEVKCRQFCCFSTSQGRLYRMFTWALAWDMPCFLSCTWYPSCKQICKKLQPKQLAENDATTPLAVAAWGWC